VDPTGVWEHSPGLTWTITADAGGYIALEREGEKTTASGPAYFTPSGTFRIDYSHWTGHKGYYEVRFSADGKTATGNWQITEGGTRGGTTAWRRTSAVPKPPPPQPQPPGGPAWHASVRLTWAVALVNGAGSALIEGVSEKFRFGDQYYNPIRAGSPGLPNVLGLLQSAVLGNKEVNVQVDKDGWILAVALSADAAIPLPANNPATVAAGVIQMPATAMFDGLVRAALATSGDRAAWIYVDGRAGPALEGSSGPRSQPVRGWVKLNGDSSGAASRVFNLAGQAGALGNRVRIYTDASRQIDAAYLWRK
jgi:hypothetical protein